MTVNEMITIFDQIPGNADVQSDSGWEVCASDCVRAFYSEEDNTVVFTQEFAHKVYDNKEKWKEIFPRR